MKSHRFGVWGLALGAVLLSAACDDQTEVVIPTPPPDPIAVTVTPASLTMEIGQTAQFVATVSGGAEGTVRTVTWASSNSTVATVDANGVVTAVAEGVTTITATSTADNTARGAAAVTVTPDPANAPVTISIQRITTGATTIPVDINNVSKQIDVTLNLEGSPPAVISRVETLIDGTVVCSQSFSTGGADVAASDEAQANVEIICSINTAAFNATTGETTWRNGPHNLQARAVRPTGEVVATPSTTLIFNNTNFINVGFSGSGAPATSANSPRSLAAAGSLWHTGDITVNLLSVNYDGADDAVATTTVTITTSGFGVNGLDDCVPVESGQADDDETIAVDDGGDGPTVDPDGGGPLDPDPSFPGCGRASAVQVGMGAVTTVTFPTDDDMDDDGVEGVEDVMDIIIQAVTVGGEAGPQCINPDPEANPQGPNCEAFFRNPLRVDNLYPRVTQLSIERQPNQYFGPNVFTLDHEAGATVAVDGECDAPCARTVDYGAGGTDATFLAGELGEEVTLTDGGPELEESATSEDYVFAVMVTDNTGNSDTRWATDPLETGGDVSFTTNDPEDDEDILQFFGWDATNPSVEVVAGPDDMDVNPDETDPDIDPVNLLPIDEADAPAGPSGFLADPFRIRARRLLPGGTTCRNVEGGYASVSCGGAAQGFVASDGIFDLPASAAQEAYFEYTVRLSDAAGNPAEELVFWILEDVTAPDVGGINSPSTIEGGEEVGFEADAEDNVELGSLQPYLGFGGTYVNFPHTGGTKGLTVLGEFGFESFDDELEVSATIAHMIRSLDTSTGGVPNNGAVDTDEIMFNVRDIAGHRLRFVESPWQIAPDDGGVCPGQNCTASTESILTRVEGPPGADTFDDLVVLNGDLGNPGTADVPGGDFGFNWGSFRMLGYGAGDDIVCNSTETEDECPTEASNTIALEGIVQGPRGSFANPFAHVWFVYLTAEGNWDYIATASVSVIDNTIENTRTFRYRGTWNAADLKVRPAGDPGTIYDVIAIGVNADGDALMSAPVSITVEGDPE